MSEANEGSSQTTGSAFQPIMTYPTPEMIAAAIAHRVCIGQEHDPANKEVDDDAETAPPSSVDSVRCSAVSMRVTSGIGRMYPLWQVRPAPSRWACLVLRRLPSSRRFSLLVEDAPATTEAPNQFIQATAYCRA